MQGMTNYDDSDDDDRCDIKIRFFISKTSSETFVCLFFI